MGKKKSQRIDTRAEPEALSHNPFAALGATRDAAPSSEAPCAPSGGDDSPTPAPFTIGRTRKGGFALSIERRAGGKVVTVVGNVSGDAGALLKTLKKACGTGGAVREGAIELQGDQRERLEALLPGLG
ncbi:MAG: translation initiation factor [Candidatus Hydrogenedentes bacterium]|nr:translation initiation factor [Candidatus Hydrogenedentota bacterium]